MLIEPYSPATEQRMKTLYQSLNERDRRRYAAVEADKLGYGGQAYISQLLGCDHKTLQRGLDELDDPPNLPPGRIRKKGGA
ncbi:MAG TPA: hypothetical protein VIK18_03450 [Pirellulales bacterium]